MSPSQVLNCWVQSMHITVTPQKTAFEICTDVHTGWLLWRIANDWWSQNGGKERNIAIAGRCFPNNGRTRLNLVGLMEASDSCKYHQHLMSHFLVVNSQLYALFGAIVKWSSPLTFYLNFLSDYLFAYVETASELGSAANGGRFAEHSATTHVAAVFSLGQPGLLRQGPVETPYLPYCPDFLQTFLADWCQRCHDNCDKSVRNPSS